MPQTTLDQGGLWSGGAFGHLLQIAIPLIIFGLLMRAGIHAARKGLTLVASTSTNQNLGPELEQLNAAEPDGRAQGFDGFDPSIYGPLPDQPPDQPPDTAIPTA